jgi:cation:H+ antiporter
MLVSALAAFDGAPQLGIGNALGSNIANVGLVLGITILVSPLAVKSGTLKREFPLLTFIMAVALLLMWDLRLSFIDGLILFTGFIVTLFGMAVLAIRSGKKDPLEAEFEQEYAEPQMSTVKSILWFSLTIVAIGTSLPELAASIVSVLKNEHDIAVGNILGSNMFNLLAVLAMPGLIQPTSIDAEVLVRDYTTMVALFVMLYLFSRLGENGKLGRLAGSSLLLVYVAYNSLLAYQSTAGA